MQLFLRSSLNLRCFSHRLLSCQFISTHPSSSSRTSSPAAANDLYPRIWRAGHPTASMVPILEKWLEEGKFIKKSDLQILIRQLRNFRRYAHALQILQWMKDQKCFNSSLGDDAVQLDLITKVHGIKEAETYFNSIPEESRGYQVYGALLNSYAHAKHVKEVEALKKKMEELGFIKTQLPYHVILSLYSRLGKYEKLDGLVQEMQEKGITCNLFTFTILLNAYVASSNLEGMEKLIAKIESDPHLTMDFPFCSVAANGYLKAGLVEKALIMLRRSEQLIGYKSKKGAYESLLTLYCNAGSSADVHRIWNLYKKDVGFFNVGYQCMVSSLWKLDDMAGAEAIWDEWFNGQKFFDLKILNFMIKAYCKRGLLEKAEAVINKIIESGVEPDCGTWDQMAAGYYAAGHMTKALETIKKAILISKLEKRPNLYNLEVFLGYLKDQGDMEAAEELLEMIKANCRFSPAGYNRLSSCINKENLTTGDFNQTATGENNDGGREENEEPLNEPCQ